MAGIDWTAKAPHLGQSCRGGEGAVIKVRRSIVQRTTLSSCHGNGNNQTHHEGPQNGGSCQLQRRASLASYAGHKATLQGLVCIRGEEGRPAK